ncbi:NADH dehydrogenase, FAD-containing subunit [Nocardia amikacinitolerans]|uniref:NADH dehydrogenase, FAD-containing subunit n=1 Tax=Nocardia amikacinitolerans TaxID=756689 RepID=A0A285M2W9_9NOCA|nr:FAD-dependent oxidoreductase [Nocardia amikacinitolerans]SNY89871.1 NADH dehydrogenase, FAD-containing subunit [Nocardia amikacinitolerans]
MNTEHRIVILGAGYTGMLAAVRLARRTRRLPVRITLVNPSDRFTERLRMHQIATGQELADHRIPEILDGTGVEFVCGWATSVNPEARLVTVDGDRVLPYDELVYALGSATDTDKVPGVAEHAWTLNDPRTAHRFAGRLAAVAAHGGSVAVCGGGLTGIEAAAEIAERHPGLRVTLISTGEPGAMMGERARAYLHRALDRLGITRSTGRSVTKVLPDAVELADGTVVPADLTLWTAGVRVAPLAARAGIETDERGLIVVDQTLKSVSHPTIRAIGDAAAVRQAWGTIHGTCQSGMPTAAYTADTPRRFHLTGRAAVLYKETVSGSPPKTFRLSKKMTVAVQLSRGGRATRTRD